MSKVLVIILEVFQVIFTKYYIAFHCELFTVGYTKTISLSQEELQQFRQYYICEWVLDPDNIHRDMILHVIKYNTFDFPTKE